MPNPYQTEMPSLLRCFFATFICLVAVSAQAQIIVNSLDDDGAGGDCELREAIINANNDDQSGSTDCAAGSGVDTIDLTGISGTIVLNGSELSVTSHMDILGPGSDKLTIDGDAKSRIFNIGGGTLVSIKHLTLTNGAAVISGVGGDGGGAILNNGILTVQYAVITKNLAFYGSGIMNSNAGSPYTSLNGTLNLALSEVSYNFAPDTVFGNGGGINNNSQAVATILASTINNNRSGVGGGIYTLGVAHIVNSTISQNTASGSGGAIYAQASNIPNDTLSIRHSTITNNNAAQGGGIFIVITNQPDTANVSLYRSVIAGNFRESGLDGPDIKGPVLNSEGYNLLGDDSDSFGLTDGVNGDQVGSGASPIDPMLFALAYNGGTTKSHLPMAGSPALDNGSCALTHISDDQRLYSRPLDLNDGTYPDADDACDIGADEVYELEVSSGIKFSAGAFLEGPYSGSGVMSLTLNPDVPTSQPYSWSGYDGTVIDYDGSESVPSVPANAVDWILVSLRTGTAAETEVIEQPAFLNNEGAIMGLDGDTLSLPVGPGSYWVVVRHRNHMSVMSSDPVDFTTGLGEYEFRHDLGRAYTVGGTPMKSLGDGSYGMFASDGNADGQSTAPDFNLWNAATTAGATGYLPSDYNLDGQVTAPDFNLWNANTTAGAASRVPD